MPTFLIVMAALLGFTLAPETCQCPRHLVKSEPQRVPMFRPASWICRSSPISRIDRARSRLILTRPDHSQSVLKIVPSGPPELLQTSTELTTPGAYVGTLAGTGDRRPYHPRRCALHRHGPLTRDAADGSVRLFVDRPRGPHHRRAVNRTGRVLFIALLLRPIVSQLGSTGQGIERTCTSIAA